MINTSLKNVLLCWLCGELVFFSLFRMESLSIFFLGNAWKLWFSKTVRICICVHVMEKPASCGDLTKFTLWMNDECQWQKGNENFGQPRSAPRELEEHVVYQTPCLCAWYRREEAPWKNTENPYFLQCLWVTAGFFLRKNNGLIAFIMRVDHHVAQKILHFICWALNNCFCLWLGKEAWTLSGGTTRTHQSNGSVSFSLHSLNLNCLCVQPWKWNSEEGIMGLTV
jgi:hypothetical protein